MRVNYIIDLIIVMVMSALSRIKIQIYIYNNHKSEKDQHVIITALYCFLPPLHYYRATYYTLYIANLAAQLLLPNNTSHHPRFS